MTPITLSPHEVKLALKGEPFQLIRPVEHNIASNLDYDPRDASYGPFFEDEYGDSREVIELSPFGKPGDEFWVQEEWRQAYPETSYSKGIVYRADKAKALGMDEYSDHYTWQPASLMLCEISRLTLTHTGTEVKRVQDVAFSEIVHGLGWDGNKTPYSIPEWFMKNWQSQHPDYPWEENPWVFIGKFEVKR